MARIKPKSRKGLTPQSLLKSKHLKVPGGEGLGTSTESSLVLSVLVQSYIFHLF
jgi:hypothetical protein